jgi:superfamily II DNA or RNA helicase
MHHLANVERGALWAKPGMGKTVMTMTFLDHLHNVWGEGAPTLVLAPLRVARDTWANEASKWEHLAGMEVVTLMEDVETKSVTARFPLVASATATYRKGYGCVLEPWEG